MKGIDISHWQGNVDFHALRDNVEFVIIKATQGINFTDPKFTSYRDGARKEGLPLGFYHYAYPQYNSPLAEADYFTKVVSCMPGEIMCLDFEEHYPDPVNWCKTFLDKCKSNMGFSPILYINYALAKSYDWSPVAKAGYGLWLAYWTYSPDSDVPKDLAWTVTAMRQYSNNGNVAGISPVDLDVFYGDVDQFKKYGNPPPPPAEPPQTPPSIPGTPELPPVGIPQPQPPTNGQSLLRRIIEWVLGLFSKKW